MDLTTEQVTLVAALLAFVASVVTLAGNLFKQRSSDFGAAHRRLLEPHVHNLSEALHQIGASSSLLIKNRDNDVVSARWREKADEAQSEIKKCRRVLRYPLWGLDDGLRTVSRLADWVDHVRATPETAQSILDAGGELRGALDQAIRKSYLKGRPPHFIDVARVNRHSKKLKQVRDRVMQIPQTARA